MIKLMINIMIFVLISTSCSSEDDIKKNINEKNKMNENIKLDTATLGAGCFWCVEAVFQQIKGVYKVESGYSGGRRENPTYQQICSGATGHAEVCLSLIHI